MRRAIVPPGITRPIFTRRPLWRRILAFFWSC